MSSVDLKLKCFFFSVTSCSAITEVPEVSDEEATIASSVEYCGHLVMKENGTSPFQKCLETKDISPDEQYNMCVTDVSLYYGKNINDLEKAVCNNLGSFALQCEEKDVTVDWRNDELCRKYIITVHIYVSVLLLYIRQGLVLGLYDICQHFNGSQ